MLEGEATYPREEEALQDDINAAMNAYAHDVAGADNEEDWETVTDAFCVGYAVCEAESRADQMVRPERVETPEPGDARIGLLANRGMEVAERLEDVFAYGAAGWAAVERWAYQFATARHVGRTGHGHELDLLSAFRIGYGVRRAVHAVA